jgi:hypothetical protein
MKIQLNKKFGGITEKSSTVPRRGGVSVGNIKTERVFLNANGDEINPRTKEIIKKNEVEKLIMK